MLREISIAFQTDKSAGDYIALAQLVNQYDFDRVSVYCDAPFHPSYGPLLLMAPHIYRAKLGPAAVSPSRIHPIDIAAQAALLAQVAQGGVYIGIARGAWLEQHGIAEKKPAIQAVREAVEIVRYLLSGSRGGYTGKVFQIAENVYAPYPTPDVAIPVMIGTWGPRMCALAGEIADEVKVGGSANPALVPLIQRYIADGERRTGRHTGTVGVAMGAVTVIDEDREQARAVARQSVALYLPIVAALDSTVDVEPELVERLRVLADQHDYSAAANLVSDELLDLFAFSGAPDDLIQQVEGLFDAGVQRIEFGTPHGINPGAGVALIGEKVLPALRTHWL
jgi:5,10-methylenetetrahydromethanopterin reductase